MTGPLEDWLPALLIESAPVSIFGVSENSQYLITRLKVKLHLLHYYVQQCVTRFVLTPSKCHNIALSPAQTIISAQRAPSLSNWAPLVGGGGGGGGGLLASRPALCPPPPHLRTAEGHSKVTSMSLQGHPGGARCHCAARDFLNSFSVGHSLLSTRFSPDP